MLKSSQVKSDPAHASRLRDPPWQDAEIRGLTQKVRTHRLNRQSQNAPLLLCLASQFFSLQVRAAFCVVGCPKAPMPPKKKKAAEPEPVAVAAPEASGEESNERYVPGANDWEPAKIYVRPKEQLQLSDKELKEEFTRILKADNPEVCLRGEHGVKQKTLIRFSHKEKCYKVDGTIEQAEVHFAQEGILLDVKSDEAKKQKEKEDDEKAAQARQIELAHQEGGDGGDGDETNLRNQFNFSERASQTLNNALRERGTMTEPPPSVEYSSQCTQWEMYDAYMEDLERKKELEGKKSKKGGAPKKTTNQSQQKGSEDVVHTAAMAHAAKILERMCNQNTFSDVTEDFKFWEDQSDLYRDEGTLLPLWR